MKKQVTISKNPEAKFFNETEEIKSYDITHCQLLLKRLLEIAEMVDNSSHDESCNLTQHAIMMSHLIQQIYKGINK